MTEVLREKRKGSGMIKNAELTKKKIMSAAKKEFAAHGFDGARVDVIAQRAHVNKQLIYYYFKNKDYLFVESLKECFATLRKVENAVNLEENSAFDAILKLARATWDYYIKDPELIYLLASENLMHARHLKEYKQEFLNINASWLENTQRIIEKGKIDKSIRAYIDPIELNISVAGMIIFSITNQYTLSYTLGCDLTSKEVRKMRIQSILDTIATWIKP